MAKKPIAKKKISEDDCDVPLNVSAANEKVIAKIKDAGFRMTQSRLKILELFAGSHEAFSPSEVFSLLNEKNKKESFDRVTVYRILEKFAELEIIHPVGNGKYVYCMHQSCAHDQHFILICDRCHKVAEVGSQSKTVMALTDLLKKESGFTVANNAIVLRGLCAACSKSR
jgi:Fur family transcriptional regulator, zinc uptake regulator